LWQVQQKPPKSLTLVIGLSLFALIVLESAKWESFALADIFFSRKWGGERLKMAKKYRF
jgi:hypothetical protein